MYYLLQKYIACPSKRSLPTQTPKNCSSTQCVSPQTFTPTATPINRQRSARKSQPILKSPDNIIIMRGEHKTRTTKISVVKQRSKNRKCSMCKNAPEKLQLRRQKHQKHLKESKADERQRVVVESIKYYEMIQAESKQAALLTNQAISRIQRKRKSTVGWKSCQQLSIGQLTAKPRFNLVLYLQTVRQAIQNEAKPDACVVNLTNQKYIALNVFKGGNREQFCILYSDRNLSYLKQAGRKISELSTSITDCIFAIWIGKEVIFWIGLPLKHTQRAQARQAIENLILAHPDQHQMIGQNGIVHVLDWRGIYSYFKLQPRQ